MPLAEAQRAHELMGSRENVGKIVLVPQADACAALGGELTLF